MEEIRIVMIMILILYWVDLYFTIKLTKKYEKIYENPEELELNYHKYFMKKYGIYKGGLISFLIGIIILTIMLIITLKLFPIFLYIFLGMIFMTAYINFISYITYEETKEKLIKKICLI